MKMIWNVSTLLSYTLSTCLLSAKQLKYAAPVITLEDAKILDGRIDRVLIFCQRYIGD